MDGEASEVTLALADGSKPSLAADTSMTCTFKGPDVGALRYATLRMIEGSSPEAEVSTASSCGKGRQAPAPEP